MQRRQFGVDRRHTLIQCLYMHGHLIEYRPRIGGNRGVGGQRAQQVRDIAGASGGHHAKLRGMAAQRVDRLRALANQHLAVFKDDTIRLLVDRFNRN